MQPLHAAGLGLTLFVLSAATTAVLQSPHAQPRPLAEMKAAASADGSRSFSADVSAPQEETAVAGRTMVAWKMPLFPSRTAASPRSAARPGSKPARASSVSRSVASAKDASAWARFRAAMRRGGGGGGPAGRTDAAPAASAGNSTALAAPAITFGNLSKNYGDADFVLSPVSDSAGTFTFSSGDTSVATISGDTVTITGVGTTVITATQAANGAYSGGTATMTLTVSKGTPDIVFDDITKNSQSSPFTLAPTSDSAGAFSFSGNHPEIATISGDTVTILAGGTVTITATQAATALFNARTVTATLTIIAVNQCASAPCGIHGVCTRTSINPGGPLDDYECTCDSGYAGENCDLVPPTLGTFSNVSKYLGDVPFTLTPPTSNSAGAFTYVSSDTGVATIAGNVVTLVSNGSATITATQAAAGGYASGTATMTLTVFFGGCISAPCENGGTCTNEPGGAYSCACEDGFSGTNCEMDTANCDPDGPSYCVNGGTCTPTPSHGECSCPACFTGSRCEQYDALNCA